MSNEELELKLLKNSELDFDGHKFRCFTLAEIIEDIGFDNYSNLTQVLSIDKSFLKQVSIEINDEIDSEILEKISTFDIFRNDIRLMEKLVSFLRVFLRHKNIYYVEEYQTIVVDKGEFENPILINGQNLDRLFGLITKAYCIRFEKQEEAKPANARAKEMLERIKKEAADNPKPKRNSADLMSVISGVAHKSHSINIYSVWKLSLFQLWDAYYRILMIEDTNNTISGIYAGTVDKDKIDMKEISWIKKYKN